MIKVQIESSAIAELNRQELAFRRRLRDAAVVLARGRRPPVVTAELVRRAVAAIGDPPARCERCHEPVTGCICDLADHCPQCGRVIDDCDCDLPYPSADAGD